LNKYDLYKFSQSAKFMTGGFANGGDSYLENLKKSVIDFGAWTHVEEK